MYILIGYWKTLVLVFKLLTLGVFPFLDHLSVILGVSGAGVFLVVVFAVLIYARIRAKEQENIYTKWIINFKEIAPSDDFEDSPMMLSNYHQVS